MLGELMDCLPKKSTIISAGGLSAQGPSNIDPVLFIGRNITIEGWILFRYLQQLGLGIFSKVKLANSLISIPDLLPTVTQKVPLSQFRAAIETYKKNMSEGKVVLAPNEEDPALKGDAKFPEFEATVLAE
mmetsp:Transcript_19738/g.30459  ORF Transcript_19738/g.30459 Transcript_19738/m.30459 type:complete len:130 (-) Transcript_19738:22-411(-)